MPTQFVDGWTIEQVLGEGAFGEVKLLVNNETHDAVAVKVINTVDNKEIRLAVRKEIAIHRQLDHPNIIKFFGNRSEPGLDYIFLEYAAGGELFDRIEPDVGMASSEAQDYFLQLVSAVEYLHLRGVTHRDIKPENILLNHVDQIKLSDFGMATMFRKNGTERLLDKKCGTLPYVAPEVLLRPYNAAPADVWSCGIVLVALLAGELPWDSPSKECVEYESWRDGNVLSSPWQKLDTTALSLFKKLLAPLPDKRPEVCDIRKFRWCRIKHQDHSAGPTGPTSGVKRLISGLPKGSDSIGSPDRFCMTQPLPKPDHVTCTPASREPEMMGFCFSQPVALDNLLLSSQLHASQAASTPVYQKLVRRMTRVLVKLPVEAASTRLTDVLELLGCTVRFGPQMVLTANFTDRRKMQMTFKVNLIPMDGNVLLDFRLSKGDGLEFKKIFLNAKNALHDVVIKTSVPWTGNCTNNTSLSALSA